MSSTDVGSARSMEGTELRFDIDLVVSDDIRTVQFTSRGVDVSEVQEARPPGLNAPEGERSYFARASFSDPDGNSWVLQEVTTRLPGREWED
jgi:hypothetical protein